MGPLGEIVPRCKWWWERGGCHRCLSIIRFEYAEVFTAGSVVVIFHEAALFDHDTAEEMGHEKIREKIREE